MTKRVTIRGQSDINHYRQALLASSDETQLRVRELAETVGSLELLYQMKFKELGCDPIDSTRRLNLIEQLNQTFTYAASPAADFCVMHH